MIPVDPQKEDRTLTICLSHKNLHLGIYNNKTHQIESNCTLADLSKYGHADLGILHMVANNYTDRNIDMTHDNNAIIKAWGQDIVHRKAYERDTDISDNKFN